MFSEDLQKLVDEVNSLELSRKSAAAALRGSGASLGAFDSLEPEGLRLSVAQTVATGKVAAVDGGILAREFHGIDLYLLRSCGVCFDYFDGVVRAYEYFPSPVPSYAVRFANSLQSHEFNWRNSLLRLESELSCALECARRFSPRLLLLDGSILPQVGDRPSRDSSVYPDYELVLAKFVELYEFCQGNGIFLAGVIKDSRGRHFLDLLLKNAGAHLKEFAGALEKANDTTFLYDFLEKGERTPAFKYASAAAEHAVLRDLGDWGKKIGSFYVKPVEYDRPLRVDFLLPESKAQISELAGLINCLSQGNREYAYPAALIEADLRAAMDPSELEFVSSALFAKAGRTADLMALRRNSRPFR